MSKRKVHVRKYQRKRLGKVENVSDYDKEIEIVKISKSDEQKIKTGKSENLNDPEFTKFFETFLSIEGLVPNYNAEINDVRDEYGFIEITASDDDDMEILDEWRIYSKDYIEKENLFFDDLDDKIKVKGIKDLDDWKDLIDKKMLLEDVMDTIEQDYYSNGVGDEGSWEELEEGLIEETQSNLFGEADRLNGLQGRVGEKEEANAYYNQFVTDKTKRNYISKHMEEVANAEDVEEHEVNGKKYVILKII